MDKKEYINRLDEQKKLQEMMSRDRYLLNFHLIPPSGWLNDPNGLCQFKGTNHIYYQYTPFDATWGMKLWGHYTTEDWVTYKEYEPFLFSDIKDDRDGVYSGSAFIKDDEIYFYYTGNVKYTDKKYDYISAGREQNTIMMRSKDGFTYDEKRTILKNSDYPNMSCHVRDPQIIERDGVFYMVLGARDLEDRGCVLIYSSKDLENWSYHMRIDSQEKFGYMWECPDYFETEGRKILSTSVQGLEGGVWDARNVYQSGYFLVEGDILSEYVLSDYELWDYGFDYYAPQSFESEDGRRIHISWMGMPDCEEYTNLTLEDGWQHCFTFPREVHVKDKKVLQQPVKELEALRRGEERAVSVLEKKGTKVFEAEVQNITGNHFRAVLAKELVLEYVNGRFEMKFTSQDKTSVSAGRSLRFREVSEVRNVRILADVSSVEVFVNDGETVFSTRYYPQDYEIKIEALDAKIAFWEL